MPAEHLDEWQCGWCKGMGIRTMAYLPASALWRVGEHTTLQCDDCERRWPWREDDWQRRYVGSPFVLVRHPWTPAQPPPA